MIKIMLCALVSALLLATGNVLAAEPSSTVRELMAKPLSIFDWGLFRLQQDLEQDLKFDQTKEFQPSTSYVDYTGKTNTIEIGIFVYPKQSFLKEVVANNICRNVTNYVRRLLSTGMPKHIRANTGIARYFTTSTFPKSPEKLSEEIEAITRIKVNVGGSETDKPNSPQKTLSECESPLLGETVLFKEQAVGEKGNR